MDRNTATGLILIFLIMLAWFYFTMPTQEEMQRRQAEQARQDSIAAAQASADSIARQQGQQVTETDPDTGQQQQQPRQQTLRGDEEEPSEMGMFGQSGVSDTAKVTVETPLYTVEFTNVGAGPAKFTLKRYETWNHQPVQMIADTTQSAYTLGFLSNENYNVETSDILFEQVTQGSTLQLEEGETRELQYALNLENGGQILYTYTLRGDSYEMDLSIEFSGLDRNIIGGTVDFGWEPRINFTEKDHTIEGPQASAYAYLGGEMEQLLISEAGREERNFNGDIDWVSTRTKFFAQVIEPETPTEGALLIGEVSGAVDNPNTRHHYESYIKSDIPENGLVEYRMYVGPLAYNSLKKFDSAAYDMVDVGWSWIRWFSDPLVRFIVIPFFGFVSDYMSIGMGIILFAILIKVVLYPLTKKSYKSMAAMKELQPKMKEIQEKYSDKPEKQQKETLKLYKEAGVNPLGGCLPNLLQFPILITLWRFFQNSIMIRQEEFLWAADLSAPDYILGLPFSIPFLGDQLAGFVLLMSAAMVAQSKITGGMGGGMGGGGGGMGAGQMKMFQYLLPVMLLFIFNNFAAGLSLYYLIYNVVSIIQQLMINRQIDKENGEKVEAN
ncbi:membrane protein insertase YidC [Aliifodinibius sp. S!AR15-10]|uniref:membrane protein insertase YidC n=1 Tax=Aliifodinibius sp. S!AR15-10 TaxID=2950437 RepID=UPI00285A4BEE|nr:membrane protein insertase YidC [Aliifodinibius sp. S!AR15-10]MDR8393636.1 membrane protein insertase YidC [Aliifodinibius sp. S!AR15-10]